MGPFELDQREDWDVTCLMQNLGSQVAHSNLSHQPPGVFKGPKMNFKLSALVLLVAMVAVLAQRRRPAKDEWNYRDGSEKVSMRGVANLTQVLDNWRFDILNEMKNSLLNDHQSVLPDYGRIQPLSEALDDLYKEFNALKAHLGDLSEKVVAIETFMDELKTERAASVIPVKRRVIKKKVPGSQS
ncbi:hypothetical protein GJAV_G00216310 [Gymnothorax javanicus]|nr:hypothetical protein GJAV_G00216310 [Gymnothorax javanicus]